MTWQAILALVVAVGALGLMTGRRVAADQALCLAVAVLVVAGVVSPARALSGLSNEGMVTVAFLFVVAAAVQRSGALVLFTQAMLGQRRALWIAQLRMMLPVTALSAFLNNTPVVAMLLPEVREWAQRHNVAISRLLIPLSYAAILGGMCTLIGTSTNLLVAGLLTERGHDRLGIFEISVVGVPAAIAGILVILLLARLVLPDRSARDMPFADPRAFTTEFTVDPGGPLVGKRLSDVMVPGLRTFNPVEIGRPTGAIPAPRPDAVLAAGDHLIFAAPAAEVLALHRFPGLTPVRGRVQDESGPGPGTLLEVVVAPRSPLIGTVVGEGSFRRYYGAAVVAVARDGERLSPGPLGTWRIAAGDTLLIEGTSTFLDRYEYSGHFFVVTRRGTSSRASLWHRPFSLVVVGAMVAAAATGLTTMLVASMVAAALLLGTKVLRWTEARTDIDWRVLLAIAAAIGLGAALEDSGAAAAVAGALVSLGGDHPLLALTFIYLATVLCTELVTNNAAAVLMLPIALNVAADLEAAPMPFIAGVMFAASASFVTPIGYQTNLMVYGPGGYHFGDFVRAGAAVQLVVAAVVLAMAPLIWPF